MSTGKHSADPIPPKPHNHTIQQPVTTICPANLKRISPYLPPIKIHCHRPQFTQPFGKFNLHKALKAASLPLSIGYMLTFWLHYSIQRNFVHRFLLETVVAQIDKNNFLVLTSSNPIFFIYMNEYDNGIKHYLYYW